MKYKNRALSLLLALVMVFTFMPVMTFQAYAEGSDPLWKVSAKDEEVYLSEDGVCRIEVITDLSAYSESETELPVLSYQWYSCSYDEVTETTERTIIAGETNAYYLAGPGVYTCIVKDENNYSRSVDFWVYEDADDHEVWYEGGEYIGTPEFRMVEKDDVSYYYEFRPVSGNVITIETKDGKKSYVYDGISDYKYWFVNQKDETDKIWSGFEGGDYNEATSEYLLSVCNSGAKWYSVIRIKNLAFDNSVVKISFEPSEIYLDPESIAEQDEYGETDYYFGKRSKHTFDGHSWDSAFAAGDKLTVYYKDRPAKTFVNIDKKFEHDVDDVEYEDCFTDGEYYIWPYADWDTLKMGSNTVKVCWHGVSTTIKVTLETAEEKAAREAAEKAAADKAAKEAAEKAAAEAAAAKAAEEKAAAEAAAAAAKAAEEKAAAEAEAKAKAEALAKASSINKATVSASDIKKASKLGATSITLGAKVKKIKANAFKGTKIKTVTVKSRKLTAKSVKGSLKGSKVKTIKVKVGKAKDNKKYVKAYKKIFTKKNAGKKVTVK